MATTQPEPIEPCAIYRMRRNGWSGPAIAQLFNAHLAVIAQAEREQTEALKGIDKARIINTCLTP